MAILSSELIQIASPAGHRLGCYQQRTVSKKHDTVRICRVEYIQWPFEGRPLTPGTCQYLFFTSPQTHRVTTVHLSVPLASLLGFLPGSCQSHHSLSQCNHRTQPVMTAVPSRLFEGPYTYKLGSAPATINNRGHIKGSLSLSIYIHIYIHVFILYDYPTVSGWGQYPSYKDYTMWGYMRRTSTIENTHHLGADVKFPKLGNRV